MTKFLVIFLLVGWLLQPLSVVLAQEMPTPTAVPENAEGNINPENLIFSRPTVADQIKDVKNSYRGQLETYRDLERKYEIAFGQYNQLKTLISLEEAVKATREVMISRDEVLRSYLTLLRLEMVEATGINLTQKDPTLKELERVLQELETHQKQVEAVTDRYQLQQAVSAFESLKLPIQNIANKSSSLLAVGKLQTVYDKSLVVYEEVKTVNSSSSAGLKLAERERASRETQRELNEVRDLFSNINVQLESDRADFRGTLQNLGDVYVGLTQSLNYIHELLTI